MAYDPEVHHRRSIRFQGFDYAQPGTYFVTICTHGRELSLIEHAVQDVVQRAWDSLVKRFPTVGLDEFVIMPNHVHGIIFLNRDAGEGGASPAPALGDVLCAFKSISAIAANGILARAGRPFWQRNYYERIIRDDVELNRIRQYIVDNPRMWAEDPNNPDTVRAANKP